MQREDYPMDDQEFSYHPFDRNHYPGLDLRKTAAEMAAYLRVKLAEQGTTITVEIDYDEKDLVWTNLIIRGLTVEGYQTWCLVNGILTEMPDSLYIMEEDELEAVPSGTSAPLE